MSSSVRESIAAYLFVASTAGLSVILYLGYASFFLIKAVCLLCLTTYAAVIGLFLISGAATSIPMKTLPRRAVRDLRVLMAVVQSGSMGKTAAEMAMSQPAVSKAIAEMEHTLGVQLLNRTAQGVEPTPYGRALINRGVAAFDELKQGVKEIKFIADPTAGEVRIGGSTAMALTADSLR